MTIPYLPGWWDEISKNATNLASQLPEVIQPDQVAGKRFQALIAQNPQLITQISNMDPTARQAMASALGFRDYDKSGLGNIAEGQDLQDRKAVSDFLGKATPRQKEQRVAKLAGVEDSTTIERGDKVFGLSVQGKEQELRTGAQKEQLQALELEEKNQFKTLMDSLKTKYPAENIDLGDAMAKFISGKIETPELQRIINDPTIAPAFSSLIDLYKQRIALAAQRDIASLRSPQEKLLGLQFLQQGVDNALQKVNAAEAQMKTLGGTAAMGIFVSPEQKAQYTAAAEQRRIAQQEHQQFVNAFNSALKTEFGGKYPEIFDPAKIGLGSLTGPISPKIRAAVDRIKSGAASLEALELSPIFTAQEKAAIRQLLSSGAK